MDKNVRKYLYDVLESIETIEEYLGEEKNYLKYEANRMLQKEIWRLLEKQ